MSSIYADRRTQDSIHSPRRCKIPQRQPPSRLKPAPAAHRLGKNADTVKNKTTAPSSQYNRQVLKSGPLRDQSRPKSAISSKSSKSLRSMSGKDGGACNRSLVHKDSNKEAQTIVVPVSLAEPFLNEHFRTLTESIRKSDESGEYNISSDIDKVLHEIMDRADQGMPNDLCELQKSWEEKLSRYLSLKKDLDEQQRTVLHLLASLMKTHEKMKKMGKEPQLPPTRELNINMSNYRLLQISTYESPAGNDRSESIDFARIYEAPTKIVMACEQLLVKRQEIIDWFDKLREQHGISMSKYSKKIDDFNAETQILFASVNLIKTEFTLKLNEIVDHLRNGQDRAMTLQLRIDELAYEVSELNSQNVDLRKQAQEYRQSKGHHSKHYEELQKQVKEKECEIVTLEEHLSRAAVELKTAVENTVQLETALEQTRTQNWNLEKTIEQLTEQNAKLQYDFDSELNKLTTSIKENTLHLEEIAEARKKLQTEKEDLERRLVELSDSYNESMENKKEEINVTMAKLVEAKGKYEKEIEKNEELQRDHEKLYAEALAAELRHKETQQTLDEREAEILAKEAELKDLKNQQQLMNQELEDSRINLEKRNKTISELEQNLIETMAVENNLRSEIANKDECIAELEKQDASLEQQLQENEKQMESYEQQLKTLKEDIEQLKNAEQTENELHEMIDKQNESLYQVTQEKELLIEEREKWNQDKEQLIQEKDQLIQEKLQLNQEKEQLNQKIEQLTQEKEQMNIEEELLKQEKQQIKQENEQLTETLKEKESLIEQYLEILTQQKNTLQESGAIVEKLKLQLEEKTNICLHMQSSLQKRRNIAERNIEIESLEANLNTRMHEVSELKKLIHTLEEQLRKLSTQRQRDQVRIMKLEKTLNEYETYHVEARCSANNSVDNLDTLIKILEEELGTINEANLGDDIHNSVTQKYIKNFNNDNESIEYPGGRDKVPTKIAMENYVRRTFNAVDTKEEETQRTESLHRKRATTQMDAALKQSSMLDQGVASVAHPAKLMPRVAPVPLTNGQTRTMLINNIQYLATNQQKDERKIKMLKLTGHRLQ